MTTIKPYALRLQPHEDLKIQLQNFARHHSLQAAAIVSAVGSLEQVNLRFANQPAGTIKQGYFEIVSLSGTLSAESCHLHISAAGTDGLVIGGHLLDGNYIFTTAEIVLLELLPFTFTRALDETYGFRELVVNPRQPNTTA